MNNKKSMFLPAEEIRENIILSLGKDFDFKRSYNCGFNGSGKNFIICVDPDVPTEDVHIYCIGYNPSDRTMNVKTLIVKYTPEEKSVFVTLILNRASFSM